MQINPKVAAESIKAFVKHCGGHAKHSESLELVAKLCGFDSYRAMKAVNERDSAAVVPSPDPRAIEKAEHVRFRTVAVDWELADNPEATLEEIPKYRRGRYDVVFEEFGSQFRLLLKPEGTNIDSFDGKPVLDMFIEINDGHPCVHMTNDPEGEMLLTVFGHGHGLVGRPDEGEFIRASKAAEPLYDLAFRNGGEYSDRLFAIENDTAERYRTREELAELVKTTGDMQEAPSPAVPVVVASEPELPSVIMNLLKPVEIDYRGSYVEVGYIRPEPDSADQRLTLDVSWRAVNHVLKPEGQVRVKVPYTDKEAYEGLKGLAHRVSQIVEFFLSTGCPMKDVTTLVEKIAKSQFPLCAAQDVLTETERYGVAWEPAYCAALAALD